MAFAPLTGLFAERYQIERELGHGATAIVYLAHDNKQSREIALKVLSKDLAHALGPQRFLQEILLTARLHHPHILPIFDSGEWNGMLYYVLPYVRGESLRQSITRETQLPIEECVRITCEVADALSHAHSHGIVHRDVKPENIMLSDGHALLADFGIARTLDVHTGERLTSSGLIVGTSAYMSPEQAAGEERIDARSDIYSLACVLYEMLAGVQAFTGPTTQSVIAQRFKHTPRPVSTFRPQVPEYLEKALDKALAISPADRYSKIKDFAADLPNVPTAVRDRRNSPLRRMIHGNQKAFGFAAAAIIALTAALVAGNPPGNWSSPFSRRAALDSSTYIVVPSASTAKLTSGDIAAAARFDRELRKWRGIRVAQVEDQQSATRSGRPMPLSDAMDFARGRGAGRLIRVNASNEATIYDVANGTVLNDLSRDDLTSGSAASNSPLIALLMGTDRPRTTIGADTLTTSLPALLAYSAGQRALARNEISAAGTQFRLAAALDASFAPAHLWNAQLLEWLVPADTVAWVNEALLAAPSVTRLSRRDAFLANGLVALGAHDFPAACSAYRSVIAADSADYAGWLGLGECQRLDPAVIPSRASPSGFAFRTSYDAASDAYTRAVRINPGAYDLVGYMRMRDLRPIDPSKLRKGYDTQHRLFGAYPALDHDSVAYVPYPVAEFGNLKAGPSRRAALEKNLSELLKFATSWVRAVPKSAQGYESLALAREALGEIDAGSYPSLSASAAIANAMRLSTSRTQRVRLISAEIRLRVKRGEYPTARALSDSLLSSETKYDEAVSDEIIAPALFTGRLGIAGKAALATAAIPTEIQSTRIPPQVADLAAQIFAHAAFGDCGATVNTLRGELDRRLNNYLSEKERALVSPALLSRSLSLMSPCTHGQTALLIQSPDRLQRMQQSFARGEIAKIRAAFDSLDASRRFARPVDLSLDYTYQEAWLRAAIGDTARAIRQLDETLNALPSVGARVLREPGGAAALGRAFLLRAEIATAQRDQPTARRYARALSDLWANADPELQPLVARMRRMAVMPR